MVLQTKYVMARVVTVGLSCMLFGVTSSDSGVHNTAFAATTEKFADTNATSSSKTELKNVIDKAKLIITVNQKSNPSMVKELASSRTAALKVYNDSKATKTQISDVFDDLASYTNLFDKNGKQTTSMSDDDSLPTGSNMNNGVNVGYGGYGSAKAESEAEESSTVDPDKDNDKAGTSGEDTSSGYEESSSTAQSKENSHGDASPQRPTNETSHSNVGNTVVNGPTSSSHAVTTNSSSKKTKENLPGTGEDNQQTVGLSILGVLMALGLGGTGIALWLSKRSKVNKG
jgi:hypothetical protein